MTVKASKLSMLEMVASQSAAEIRERREALGMSQARLAELAGTSQQTVDRIERGVTTASRFIPAIRRILNLQVPPPESYEGRAVQNDIQTADAMLDTIIDPVEAAMRSSAAHSKQLRKQVEGADFLMPVYSMGLSSGEQLLFEDVARVVMRPEPLLSVKGGYGYFVFNDEMAPVYNIGDLLLVDPTLPPRPGDDVLIRSPRGEGFAVKIRTLAEIESGSLRVRTWAGAPPETLSAADWPTCHTIVGKYSRL